MEEKQRRRKYPYRIITEEGERYVKCDSCPFKTRLPRQIRKHIMCRHLKRQDIKKLYKCEECSFKSLRNDQLTHHVSVMHSDDTKWMTCDKCPRFRTIHKQVFNRHMKDQHAPPEEIKWFDCPHCSYKAKHKYQQRTHHATKHKTIQRTDCEYCQEVKGKVFAKILPSRIALKAVPQKSALRKSTPRKSASLKSAPRKSASLKSAPTKRASPKKAPRKSASLKSAPRKSASLKSAPRKSELLKSTPRRSGLRNRL